MLKLFLRLFCISYFVRGYVFGDFENTYCWKSNFVSQETTISICPENITLTWIQPPPNSQEEGNDITVEFQLYVDPSLNTTSSPDVNYVNVQSCVPGYCNPARVLSPNGIETNLDANNTATFKQIVKVNEGAWIVTAYCGFTTGDIQWDVGIGLEIEGLADNDYLQESSEVFIATLTCLEYTYFLFLALLIFFMRKHITKNHNIWLTVINLFGAFIFSTTTFFWNLHTTDLNCQLGVAFATMGFGLLFAPLLAKSTELYARETEKFNLSKKYKEGSPYHSCISFVVLTVVVTVNIAFVATMLGQDPPKSDTEISNGYRDSCTTGTVGVVTGGLILTFNGISVVVGLVLILLSKSEGIRKTEEQRILNSIAWVLISGIIVLIVELAFEGDNVLSFMVTSAGMLTASFGGTRWIYLAWQERRLIDKVGANAIIKKEKNFDSKGPQIVEKASFRVYKELFASPIIRGYLFNQCLETLDAESIEFCTNVYEYKENPSVKNARKIIQNYIVTGGPDTVNISGKTRKRIIERFRKIAPVLEPSFPDEKLPLPLSMPLSPDSKTPQARSEIIPSQVSSQTSPEEKKEDNGRQKFLAKMERMLTGSELSAPSEIATQDSPNRENRSGSGISRQSAQRMLRALFEDAFREVRELIFYNNWKPFRKSNFGVAAANWFVWIEYLDDFSFEEQKWVVAHLRQRNDVISSEAAIDLPLGSSSGRKRKPSYKSKVLRSPSSLRVLGRNARDSLLTTHATRKVSGSAVAESEFIFTRNVMAQTDGGRSPKSANGVGTALGPLPVGNATAIDLTAARAAVTAASSGSQIRSSKGSQFGLTQKGSRSTVSIMSNRHDQMSGQSLLNVVN